MNVHHTQHFLLRHQPEPLQVTGRRDPATETVYLTVQTAGLDAAVTFSGTDDLVRQLAGRVATVLDDLAAEPDPAAGLAEVAA